MQASKEFLILRACQRFKIENIIIKDQSVRNYLLINKIQDIISIRPFKIGNDLQ